MRHWGKHYSTGVTVMTSMTWPPSTTTCSYWTTVRLFPSLAQRHPCDSTTISSTSAGSVDPEGLLSTEGRCCLISGKYPFTIKKTAAPNPIRMPPSNQNHAGMPLVACRFVPRRLPADLRFAVITSYPALKFRAMPGYLSRAKIKFFQVNRSLKVH